MSLNDLTSSAAVDSALDEFDALGREDFLTKYGFGRARRYFVRRGDNYYDSKAVAGAAYGIQYPDRGPLTNAEFSGGEHGAKARLESLGFDVVPRPGLAAADSLPLRDALEEALRAQAERHLGEWSDDLQKAIAVTLPNAIRATVGEAFRVKGSAGAGNQAEIPWVSVMPPGLKGASEGRYVVYLFSADGSSVYLSLSQAVTGHRKKDLAGLAEELRGEAGEQPDLLTHINLEAAGDLGEKYGLATAYAIKYERGSVPSQEDLEHDLLRLLDLLGKVTDAEGLPDQRNAWLFQANPDKYAIDRALEELGGIVWVVRQHTADVRAGDRVYIWRSGKEAGVVAVGFVFDDPAPMSFDADDGYWLDTDGFDQAEPRVEVHIDAVLDPPLLRRDLLVHPVLKDLQVIKFANATNFRVSSQQDTALQEAIEAPGDIEVVTPAAFRGLKPVPSSAADRVFLPVEWLQEAVDLLAEKRQVVFYGPPGTGKTFVALELCEHLTAEGGDYRLIQFHPSYSYEDFFEGYRPKADGGGVEFVLTPGPLRQIAAAAEVDPANPYILVIDEINRGNIPKIFGELLFLLEYRGRVVQPQYSPEQPFALPENLFLLGTMNTADRSIALVDAALRRRFFFRAFLPTHEPVGSVLEKWLRHHDLDEEPVRLLKALNDDIADDEVAIGPSYFMSTDGSPPNIERVWQYAIMPLLEEYYYGTARNVSQDFALARLRKRVSAADDIEEAPLESAELAEPLASAPSDAER